MSLLLKRKCCCSPTPIVVECGRCASGLQPTPDTIKLVVSGIVSSGEFGLECVQIETANLDGEVTLTQAPFFSEYWFDSYNWGTRDRPELGSCVWRHVRPALSSFKVYTGVPPFGLCTQGILTDRFTFHEIFQAKRVTVTGGGPFSPVIGNAWRVQIFIAGIDHENPGGSINHVLYEVFDSGPADVVHNSCADAFAFSNTHADEGNLVGDTGSVVGTPQNAHAWDDEYVISPAAPDLSACFVGLTDSGLPLHDGTVRRFPNAGAVVWVAEDVRDASDNVLKDEMEYDAGTGTWFLSRWGFRPGPIPTLVWFGSKAGPEPVGTFDRIMGCDTALTVTVT